MSNITPNVGDLVGINPEEFFYDGCLEGMKDIAIVLEKSDKPLDPCSFQGTRRTRFYYKLWWLYGVRVNDRPANDAIWYDYELRIVE